MRQIAIGDSSAPHLLTLSTTGVITDYTPSGAITIPTPSGAIAIAAGTTHNLAILQTGRIFGWGSNTNGETTIPISATTGIQQIAAGNGFSLALKTDGRVIGWGRNNLGQVSIPAQATHDVYQFATGDNHAIALRIDGSVVAWGDNSVGQTTVPISVTDVIYVTANANSSAAITRSGQVFVWGATESIPDCCSGTNRIAINNSMTLTNRVNSTQTQTIMRSASLSPISILNQFNGVIPGLRYRYTIDVSNFAGSRQYTGILDTRLRYFEIFMPMLNNATDGTTSATYRRGK